jgi:uncharacterized membrane protein YfcA
MIAALLVAAAAFTLSASAGLGGSLLLVPSMVILFGAKQGVAVAALLLACNNVAKTVAYRRTIPLGAAAGVLVLTVLGAILGAGLLVALPERMVQAAVAIGITVAFASERLAHHRVRRGAAPALAFAAGTASGFSGTSGPLKGIAVRCLNLDRQHFVGAVSVISLAGDAAKVAVFSSAATIPAEGWPLLVLTFPLMIGATWCGHRLNHLVGERGYALLFWTVMAGYTVRLLA